MILIFKECLLQLVPLLGHMRKLYGDNSWYACHGLYNGNLLVTTILKNCINIVDT